MNKFGQDAEPLRLLREVVDLCKQRGLVKTAADAMDLSPQALYAWMKPAAGGAPVLTNRAAKMRLLAISHLKHAELAEIAVKAAAAVARVEKLEVEQA